MTHLTEPELYTLLDPEAGAPANSHLAACSHCRAELDSLRATFTLLRETTTHYAASNAPRAMPSAVATRHQPLFNLRPALAGWASAAVLLAAGAVGLANLHHPAAPVAVNTPVAMAVAEPNTSDEALLQSVSDAIDQPVPTSLSILAEPSTQSQPTSSVQKVQPERTN
ncbi:anti-sigma factor [Granulicella tundricola]|uniref:Uncharacterized protein n=1 Tax=Granulicella tundricola (strain ATCC BAA-1859 / DSM 23138 / MP5ACTX9) TaxID=1198114 RepID=E8WYG1_GRATM|nr:hypothetical protein [Granulicella tundricola]ADW69867.1 hypothetical protein AciX9_2844 [Granulicella tundricola MP5ACTX9]